MAATINLSSFTFTAEQIRDINELVFDDILHAPDLNFIHSMHSGIVYDKEIGFLGEGGLVGVAKQGCNPTAQDWAISTRKVTWAPKAWEIYLDECANDLAATAAIYAQHTGNRVDDLTDTDYMAIVAQVLESAIRDFFYRVLWLGDTAADNVSNGGVITNGVSVAYFTLLDGFFKQLRAAVTATPALGVTIAANSQATKSAQMAGMTDSAAYGILESMYYAAPIELRSSGNMMFIVTQTIADAYQKYLVGKGIESTYRNLVDGVPSLKFLGVPVIPMPIWDKQIQSYEDNGTTWSYPHRAVLIEKDNLAVGTPEDDAYEGLDIWYDKTTRKNYLLVTDKIDGKLTNAKRLVYAE